MLLLFLAIMPIAVFCAYIYRLDRYEKEPLYLLSLSLFYGTLITCAVIWCEVYIIDRINTQSAYMRAFLMSFAAIAPVEEGFKFTVLYFLIRFNSNLNEPYDGIVYAVFVSLGFALAENILYCFNPYIGGYLTAVMRSFFSIPGHGIFGIFMGYYFSASVLEGKKRYMFLSLLYPYILHSVYDLILFSHMPVYFIPFGIFMLFLFLSADKLINRRIGCFP